MLWSDPLRKVLVGILGATLVLAPTAALTQQVPEKDYYYEGQAAAERDYAGTGAVLGGLAAGGLLGLIGWGIGWAITSNMDVDVPRYYVSNLDTKQRLDFEKGYKDYVKKRRTSRFHIGAAIGTLTAVLIYVVAASGSSD